MSVIPDVSQGPLDPSSAPSDQWPPLRVYLHQETRNGGKASISDDLRAQPRCNVNRYARIKPLLARMFAVALLPVVIPTLALVAAAIWLFQGRPLFYRQTRVGKNGRLFQIWKFRTMCEHAEKNTGAVWSHARDPRVTPLGRWLRCTHLDELPQILNVLAGEMSVVGPRPERPEFVEELSRELPFYGERLRVQPGITGLTQLKLGYDQTLADVRQKVLLDIEYIDHLSLSSDVRIIIGTGPYVVRQLLYRWRMSKQVQADSQRELATQASQSSHKPDVATPTPTDSTATPLPSPHFGQQPVMPNLGDVPTTGLVSPVVFPTLPADEAI